METWNKYFESKEQEKVEQLNEHHKEGKEEQHKYICEQLDKMSAADIKKVYEFVEGLCEKEDKEEKEDK